MGPELHHSNLVRSVKQILFSSSSTSQHPPSAAFPSQLLHSLRGGQLLYSGLLDFIFSTGSSTSRAWRAGDGRVWVCVCVLYTWPENNHPFPECNTDCPHTPGAPLQNANFVLLSFSMNAQACNLAATNWIRISGGFIPPGSARSSVFHCYSCQSWGGTEVHFWQRGGICSCF